MKKILLLIAIFFLGARVQAQIINPGFETLNPDGTPAYWLPLSLFIVFPLDTACTGQGSYDSLRFVTTDAHGGNYAFEMNVHTQCDTLATGGNIRPTRYIADSGFMDMRVPFTGRPAAITFYYKFTSVMGDYAYAEVLTENDTNTVAHGIWKTYASANTWTLASIPLSYSGTDNPAYLTMSFRIGSDSIMHYGTRFLLDDMNDGGTTAVADLHQTAGINCYPVPATHLLTVQADGNLMAGNCTVTITDAMGRVVVAENEMLDNGSTQVNVDMLPPGLYLLQLAAGDVVLRTKFIK